jgi:NAD(P)-dependent dehydrogenase (short-subunit alcohol dehydrogenase family)
MSTGNEGAFEGIAIVTGANSGLGFETARKLASMSPRASVILACRNPERGAEAQQAIRESTGNIRVRALRLGRSTPSSAMRGSRVDPVQPSTDSIPFSRRITSVTSFSPSYFGPTSHRLHE